MSDDIIAANVELREAHAQRIAQVAIKRYDILRTLPERDAAGILLVGYRRKVEIDGVTLHEADYMLMNDLRSIAGAMRALVFPLFKIGELRLAVIFHLAFVLGIKEVQTMAAFWAALRREDYDAAADEMLMSNWPTHVGHTKNDRERAIELVNIMRTGIDRRRSVDRRSHP